MPSPSPKDLPATGRLNAPSGVLPRQGARVLADDKPSSSAASDLAPWAADERGEMVNAERAKIRDKAGVAIWKAIQRQAPLQAAADAGGLAAALEFAEPKLHAAFLSLCAARQRDGMVFWRAIALEDLLFLLDAPSLSFFGAQNENACALSASAMPVNPSAANENTLTLERIQEALSARPNATVDQLGDQQASAVGPYLAVHCPDADPRPAGETGRSEDFEPLGEALGLTLLDIPAVAEMGGFSQSLHDHLTRVAQAKSPMESSYAPLSGVIGPGLLDFSLGALLPVFCSLLLLTPNGPWVSLLKAAADDEERQDLAIAWLWFRLRLISAAADLSVPERRWDAALSMSEFLSEAEASLGFSPELLRQAQVHYFCQQAWTLFSLSERAMRKTLHNNTDSAQKEGAESARQFWSQITDRQGQKQWAAFLFARFDGALASAKFEPMSWLGASSFMESLPAPDFSWADVLAKKPASLAPAVAADAYRQVFFNPPPRNFQATLAVCARHANARLRGERRSAHFVEDRDAAINGASPLSIEQAVGAWVNRQNTDPSLAPGAVFSVDAAHWTPVEGLFDAWLDALGKLRLSSSEPRAMDGVDAEAAENAFLSSLWMGPSWTDALLARIPSLQTSLARRRRPFALHQFLVWTRDAHGAATASACEPLDPQGAAFFVFPSEAALLFGADRLARELCALGARAPAAAPFLELMEWAQSSGPSAMGVMRWAQSAYARYEAFDLSGQGDQQAPRAPLSALSAERSPKRL